MQPGRSLHVELCTYIALYIGRLLPVLSVAQGELDVAAPRLRRRQEDPRHEVDSSGQCEAVYRCKDVNALSCQQF